MLLLVLQTFILLSYFSNYVILFSVIKFTIFLLHYVLLCDYYLSFDISH